MANTEHLLGSTPRSEVFQHHQSGCLLCILCVKHLPAFAKYIFLHTCSLRRQRRGSSLNEKDGR